MQVVLENYKTEPAVYSYPWMISLGTIHSQKATESLVKLRLEQRIRDTKIV